MCGFIFFLFFIYLISAPVALGDNVTIPLVDGIPQSGSVAKDAFSYYQFQIAGNISLDLTCTTLNGSSSLYVTTGTEYPRTDFYYWFQPSFNQIKSVVIDPSDPYACHNVTCNYWIGIYGNDVSSFILLASSSETTKNLTSGIPQRDTVPQGAWDYFSVLVDVADSDLSIVVTPITGDPDLYVSTVYTRPNSTHYDKKATRAGSDSIDYTNASLGTYYIGVNAWSNSTFNILALITPMSNCTNTSCVVQLFDGQPQEGVVHQGTYDYYALDLSVNVSSLSFTLTKEYGDPDLYVTNDGSLPNVSNHRWSSTSVQNDSIYIQNATAGRYLVAVYAYQTAGYTLTGWTTGGYNIITLQNGIPIRGQGNARTYQYYMLPVDSTDRDFTVTVTPFSGDPDLYVSLTVTHPNATNYTWAATAYQGDSITVPMTDSRFCACPFYIAVYCYMASTYSVIASTSDVLNLENGVPQTGTVALHAFKYYKLRVVETHQDITIALTPRDGNPDLYVSIGTEPTLNNATWKVVDQNFSTSMLVIRTTDANFCSSNCTYYIGVYGSLASNFTIVATISSATTTLVSGVPFRDWVDTNTYEYFAFDVPTAGSDVAIIVTPLTGDPDLYVASNTSRPNTTNYEYYSRAAGADAIAIENSSATTWYIAVYAFQNSTFTVTAYLLCDDCPPVWLVNGVPQNSVLNQNDYQYYRFSVPANSAELTISVTRTLGDPDIYMRNDSLLPNKTFYTWSSTAFGQDLITIPNPAAGIYDIAVYAYSTTQFTITATSGGGVTLLADGIPVREDLAQGQYEYFQVHVDRNDMDLTVTVTSFNGDPDLYISTLGLPNSTFYQWAAQSPREDSITIPFTSLTLGTYWIAVRAWTNCTFTIIASFNNQVSLQDGIPQAGSVAFEASVYYKFIVGAGPRDITFTLTPYTGNAYLYISLGTPPNTTSYQWASRDPTTGQVITLFPDDPHWCAGNATYQCVYYAMVYGHQASNYSIVAIANGSITLQEGIPQRAYVNTAEYEYFTFVLHSATALLQFTVTPLSGDPDLYVSTTNEHPNVSDYQWASLAYGADTISIDYTDPHYIQGTYYVAVYAYRNSSFTIGAYVVELNGSTACDDPNVCPYNLIQNGVPQVGLLPNPGDKQYYEFHVGPERVNVTFTVTPRYGDPDMYIRNDGQRPNATFNQWSARSYGSDSVTIPASEGCVNCRYLIDIEAFSHTMFSLLASTDSGIILLENGVPFSTHNDEHTYKYFYVMVTDDSEPLTISVTALSGDPDLYVSNSSTRPNQTDFQWASLSYGSDTFVLQKPTIGQYYVSTYAYHNTSYIILATNSPISLINCAPTDDELDKTQSRLYQIIVRDVNMSGILITLTVESGDPVMYVNNFQNRSYPNSSNYQWTTAVASSTTQRYLINISSSSPGYCSNCTYFIQVVANTTLSKYSITASYGNSCSTSLSSGTPFPSSVLEGEYVYFRGIVDRADVDLTIGVTTFTGDTDVYVSVTNPLPKVNDSNSYQWSSEHDPNARGDLITISHTDPMFRTGIFYIAVYGWQTSQFTITMSTSAVVLSPGASQVGVLSSDLTAYFFFRVPNPPKDVIISLNQFNSSTSASQYTLYLSTNSSITQPDEQHHTFKFSITEGSSITIPSNDKNTCGTDCTGYYIGVAGATAGKRFTIVASMDDTIDALFSGVSFAASVSQSHIKNFLIYVPVANNFTVELQTCSGNADLYISQDSFNPGPGNYKWASTSTDSVDIATIRDANATNAANMYIGVEGREESNEYVLTAWTSGLPAQPKISQPVIHSMVGSSTVALSWKAASSADFSASELQYQVYWIQEAKSQNFVMYSPCGLAKGKTFGLFSSPLFNSTDDTILWTLNGLEKETEYKMTVVVTDPRGSTAFYDTIIETTSAEGSSGIPISLLLGIGLPVAAIVLAFIFYLLIRNRKLTKELEIEMHDVPKATLRKAVAGPPSVREQHQDKQKPYTRLLEEEDDENYAPPEPTDPSAGLSVN